jgi:hypothetical protein
MAGRTFDVSEIWFLVYFWKSDGRKLCILQLGFQKKDVAPKLYTIYFYHGKSDLKIWAASVIFKQNFPKYISNHPIGENSPNLVTLNKT